MRKDLFCVMCIMVVTSAIAFTHILSTVNGQDSPVPIEGRSKPKPDRRHKHVDVEPDVVEPVEPERVVPKPEPDSQFRVVPDVKPNVVPVPVPSPGQWHAIRTDLVQLGAKIDSLRQFVNGLGAGLIALFLLIAGDCIVWWFRYINIRKQVRGAITDRF